MAFGTLHSLPLKFKLDHGLYVWGKVGELNDLYNECYEMKHHCDVTWSDRALLTGIRAVFVIDEVLSFFLR